MTKQLVELITSVERRRDVASAGVIADGAAACPTLAQESKPGDDRAWRWSSFGLRRPCLADELVGGDALERIEPAAEVVGGNDVGEMLAELVVALVVEAPDGGVLDGSVHPLDLAVGPGVSCLGRAVLHEGSREADAAW